MYMYVCMYAYISKSRLTCSIKSNDIIHKRLLDLSRPQCMHLQVHFVEIIVIKLPCHFVIDRLIVPVCIYMYIYVCMYVCMCVCVCILLKSS